MRRKENSAKETVIKLCQDINQKDRQTHVRHSGSNI